MWSNMCHTKHAYATNTPQVIFTVVLYLVNIFISAQV